jgi:hypothetical protein
MSEGNIQGCVEVETPSYRPVIGVIADVVELSVKTRFRETSAIRFVWITDENGKLGKIAVQCVASMNQFSRLYEYVTAILWSLPPNPFDTETLIGKANLLLLVNKIWRDGRVHVHLASILPVPRDAQIPQIPADFMRAKRLGPAYCSDTYEVKTVTAGNHNADES